MEDLAVVVEPTGGRPFVFGQSSGGALALEAAARDVAIRALVVNEPPFTAGPTSEFAERLEKLVEGGQQAEAVAAFLEVSGTPPAFVAGMRAAPHWPRMEAFAPTLSHEIRLCNNGIVPTDRLAHVSATTLVLAGGESPSWAHQAARAIADDVPTGQARVLEGQRHIVVDDVLISVLKEFFV